MAKANQGGWKTASMACLRGGRNPRALHRSRSTSTLTDARRPARTGPDGALIPLAEQDRSRWSARAIAEGVALITETLARAPIGPYQLQAAIAAVHAEATRAEDTDWGQILGLYDLVKCRCRPIA